MKESKILKVVPVPEPIDGGLFVDVEFSCSSCDGSGVLRLTDPQWEHMKDDPMSDFSCPKCLHNSDCGS